MSNFAPNLAPKRRLTAPDARLEAAALRALEAQRGRCAIAPAPRAASVTAAIVRPLLKDAGIGLSDLQRGWTAIVGERLAGLTHPEKLSAGTLTVRAHASAAPFVQHQQGLIIERTNLAGAAIKALAIRQGAPPARVSNVRPIAKPLSADEERALAAALADIRFDPLRAALMRLGRAVAAG
jgi:hypothetical protein